MSEFDTDPTSLYSVKGIVILDQDGNRVIAKYFDKTTFGTTKEQKAFEKSLFQKTSRNSSSEIILLDGVTCIYRSNVDLYMYVLGSSRENELVLESLLNCLFDAISTVLRKNVEKKALIDAMDTCILIIDEIYLLLEMPRTRPKRLGSSAGADVSPPKLRRSKEIEDLVKVGESTVPFTSVERKFSLQEMRDALPDTALSEKENHPDESNQKFQDETAAITLSGVENYFLQGKIAQLNRTRVKRTKSKPIAHLADANLCEEANESDEEENDAETARFSHCDLGLLRDYLVEEDAKSKSKESFKKITKDFKWWTFCLAGGFNLLLYGVGSKRALLEEFRKTQLKSFRTLSIDGFKEDVNAKSILTSIVDSMKLKDCEPRRRSLVEWAKHIASTIERNKQQLIVLLNNIDGPNLRDPSEQSVLAALVESHAVLMVATVDHINASLLHTSHQLQLFNWIYYRADTFIFSWQEILAGQSTLLGLNPKNNQSTHSLSSPRRFVAVIGRKLSFHPSNILCNVLPQQGTCRILGPFHCCQGRISCFVRYRSPSAISGVQRPPHS
ncbi:clathrin adaptor complex small chain [Ostertagia ostertagi]